MILFIAGKETKVILLLQVRTYNESFELDLATTNDNKRNNVITQKVLQSLFLHMN